MLQAAERAGFRVVSFAEADKSYRVQHFTSVWESAFARHWGGTSVSLAEWEQAFSTTEPIGSHDVSVLAYRVAMNRWGWASAFPTLPARPSSSVTVGYCRKSALTCSGSLSSKAPGVPASTSP